MRQLSDGGSCLSAQLFRSLTKMKTRPRFCNLQTLKIGVHQYKSTHCLAHNKLKFIFVFFFYVRVRAFCSLPCCTNSVLCSAVKRQVNVNYFQTANEIQVGEYLNCNWINFYLILRDLSDFSRFTKHLTQNQLRFYNHWRIDNNRQARVFFSLRDSWN